jgi:uncharacterized protein YbjT (DUF2867 family)
MPTDLQVVLGATGRVGQALVQALAAQGAQVRAVNRSGCALVPASSAARWPMAGSCTGWRRGARRSAESKAAAG